MRCLPVFLFLLFLFSCRNAPKTLPASSATTSLQNTDTIKQAEAITADRYYHPDSLLLYVTEPSSTKEKDDDSYWREIRNTRAAKLFIAKMKEIKAREPEVRKYGLPIGAKIVEMAAVNNGRAILLWMKNEEANIVPDDELSCISVSSGSGFFTGESYASLVDTRQGRLINTIEFYEDLYIPFAIMNPEHAGMIGGLKYHAIGGDSVNPGKAQVLFLDDYNGDGSKNEFAIYLQDGCIWCNTALFGYSVTRDSLIQYNCYLQVTGPNSNFTADTTYSEVCNLVDHAFKYKIDQDDSIVFDIDYRGRGGTYNRYALSYNRQKEMFEGTLQMLTEEKMKDYPESFYAEPRRKR